MSYIYYYVDTNNPDIIKTTKSLDDFIELLYENKIVLPSEKQLKNLKLDKDYLKNTIARISNYSHRVPMYDIKSNKVFLIHDKNVYLRILYNDYRFINKKLLTSNELSYTIIKFLSYYDMSALKKTYYKIFYKSFEHNNYITTCQRPSFSSKLSHISPYYNSRELYFLGYDWNLIDKVKLTSKELAQLCLNVSAYDISAKTLIDHQMYIYDTLSIGLVKHYSLYGSYYINSYLRTSLCCLQPDCNKLYPKKNEIIRNIDLENQIVLMIDLIKKSPPFTSNHTVYRFIRNDDHLKHLNIGDTYVDSGFISTTRNPFHLQKNYQFGFILIKIQIPANINGVGLCIESYSNFPYEEEIILAPTSKFLLNNKIIAPSNYHHVLNKEVEIKYEMTLIGNFNVNFKKKNENTQAISSDTFALTFQNHYLPKIYSIDPLKLLKDDVIKPSAESVYERLKFFKDNVIKNANNQFTSKIGDIEYLFILESYNSTSVYKDFFYYEVEDGLMITSSDKKSGKINIMIEIGTHFHVNYYFRHSITEVMFDLNKAEWMEWLSCLAYIFGIREIIIHSTHLLHHDVDDDIENKQLKSRYTYSEDMYQYLKNKTKLYNERFITPNFDYSQLDYLDSYDVKNILDKNHPDELYSIYVQSEKTTVRDFYLYLIDFFPQFIQQFESKFGKIYSSKLNPFNNISYKLDADAFLYNREIIISIRSLDYNVTKGKFKKLIGEDKVFQFKNRLRTYLLDE